MSSNTTVAVMDQYVVSSERGEGIVQCSGLAHLGLPKADVSNPINSDAAATVNLAESPLTGLLLLRVTDCADELNATLQKRCGLTLSPRLQSHTQTGVCVRWMSPDCWLLSCPLDEAFDIENSLRAGVLGHMAIVNVSGGHSILDMSGVHARDVLMKSTGYDTHPDHLPAGKVVNTTFAKTQVTLRCVELVDSMSRYEIIVRRSFSDYLGLWLQHAAAEYGLNTVRQIS
ncbi:MAG: sarcosine oxidase subunit gamma [Granulosicoccus sp.]